MSELIDNRAQRLGMLKQVVRRLHEGEAPDAVRESMRTLVRECDATEIVAMEQQLIAEGVTVSQIKGMCDLHSQVTREILTPLTPPPLEPGHPVDTFRRENEALRGALARLRSAAGREDLLAALNDLMDIDKHYQRKEHLVFTALERHGINGPSTVMWAKDDDVREALKSLIRAARSGEATAPAIAAVTGGIEEMMYKEENILLPMCLRTFTDEDWAGIWRSSPRYGWCLVEPRTGYQPPAEANAAAPFDGVQLPTGTLSFAQLTAIFSTLPVDLTFVDADDRVAFFSEGPDRVFPRSRAIVGRKVQNCHPPKSVDTVERILADFREGRQSVAEFWLDFRGRFVHVRYFAVREGGRYLGTLEVTQDATAIRTLEGERRLLAYDSAPPVASRVQ
jgi:uncharacterized protein